MSDTTPKAGLREQARACRHAAAREAGAEAAQRIAAAGMEAVQACKLPARPVVAGYWPVGSEADTRPLMDRLMRAGVRVALPVVQSRSTPLIFRLWRPGDDLVPGLHGTLHPKADCETVVPDVVLAPLLAYDGAGGRLGQGGGYYDRTLAALRAEKPVIAIGVAFAAQAVDALPREVHDEPLDWLVSENGARRFR
jgi:5-formyltetrahydrofolate cyclo-ligase